MIRVDAVSDNLRVRSEAEFKKTGKRIELAVSIKAFELVLDKSLNADHAMKLRIGISNAIETARVYEAERVIRKESRAQTQDLG